MMRVNKDTLLVSCILSALYTYSGALSAHEAKIAAEGSGIIQVQAPASSLLKDKSQELANLPITYGLYRPSFLTDGNELGYNQAVNNPSWADPAQQGLTRPGWTK